MYTDYSCSEFLADLFNGDAVTSSSVISDSILFKDSATMCVCVLISPFRVVGVSLRASLVSSQSTLETSKVLPGESR